MSIVSADFEHEIPDGSKLYFGKSADVKRDIESVASAILKQYKFNEIVTPFFSYHQNLGVKSSNLLKFSDPINKEIALRADSTIDVVRIVRRRLRGENLKRLFYIQPVFKYPSQEIYQIGAELIGENDLTLCIKIVGEILAKFGLKPTLQISNLEIVKAVSRLLNLDIEIFENSKIDEIYACNLEWLNALCALSNPRDINAVLKIIPDEIKAPLINLRDLSAKFGDFNVCLSPLYYSKMRYYDKLFFRFLGENEILGGGGDYEIDGQGCSGFAIFTDCVIQNIK